MENGEKKIKDIAEKYFEGQASPEDESVLFDFVVQSDDNGHALRKWEKEWAEKRGSRNLSGDNRSRTATRMQIRDIVGNRFQLYEDTVKPKRPKHSRTIVMAAVAIAVSFGSVVISRLIDSHKVPATFTVETGTAERSKIDLPDGTEVWLNDCTKLSFTSDFNKRDRTVKLDGEAYFEVEKNSGKTFSVETDGCSVTATDAAFDITAYVDEESIRTVATEGSLQFHSETYLRTLISNEALTLDSSTGKTVCTQIRADRYISWIKDRIDYDSIALDELVRRLSRRFDVDMVFKDDQSPSPTVSVSFDSDKTIHEILDELKRTVPIDISEAGKSIVVEMRR